MPTYRGNRGNLLQHWVFAELLTALKGQAADAIPHLVLVDAHAMAPYADRCDNPGQTGFEFDNRRDDLPGEGSAYENAWDALTAANRERYPSSAVFARLIWNRPLTMILAERDPATISEIEDWSRQFNNDSHTCIELFPADWRLRFQQSFQPMVGTFLFSFDPYMFDRHGPGRNPKTGNMWPQDAVLAASATLALVDSPTIVQLSTYSVNNDNSQNEVTRTIEPPFQAVGMQLTAAIHADRSMMSLVFTRNCSINDTIAAFPDRFAHWLNRA